MKDIEMEIPQAKKTIIMTEEQLGHLFMEIKWANQKRKWTALLSFTIGFFIGLLIALMLTG